MDEKSNTILFSHLLDETIIEIDELDTQAEIETSLFFADKRVSLSADFIDDLKIYIHACGTSLPITDIGLEIYARILSEERGEAISINEAEQVLKQKIKDKKDRKDASWTGVPKAFYKSMENGDTQATQELFNRWYLLISFFSRDGIDAYDIERIATNNLETMTQSMQNVCLKHVGYYTEHMEETKQVGDNCEEKLVETVSFIPEIYAPDIDGLYIECRDKYKEGSDPWAEIIATDSMDETPALEKINSLVGHDEFKKLANELSDIHQSGVLDMKEKFLNSSNPQMVQSGHHMALLGNPGTGKTTMARLVGQLHHEVGNLSKGHVVEVSVKDLVANVIGGTAIKTGLKIAEAKGGVLFIDEADKLYESASTKHNFALQAVNELLIAMENEQDLVVIFAGYKKPMQKLLRSNSGIPRRVRHTITCSDFTVSQLMDVLEVQLTQRGLVMTNAAIKMFEEQTEVNKKVIDDEF